MSPASTLLGEPAASFLEDFGFRQVRVAAPLQGGMFSRPVPIDADGKQYLLRTHTFRATVEAFRFQAEVLRQAAAGGVRCPQVVPTPAGAWCQALPNGQGVLALHEFVEGQCDDWSTWHARIARGPDFLFELGAAIGRLHQALRRAPLGGDAHLADSLPPIQFERLAAMERQWTGDLETLATSLPKSPATQQLLSLRPRIADHWARIRTAIESRLAELPRQVVHGDISPVNLVWEADGGWSLIDWDCTHIGTRLYDALGDVLHRAPADQPELNVFRVDHVLKYLNGYQSTLDVPLCEAERALVMQFSAARQLEDLRQRVRVLPVLAPEHHAQYAVLIQRRLEMLDQIAADRSLGNGLSSPTSKAAYRRSNHGSH